MRAQFFAQFFAQISDIRGLISLVVLIGGAVLLKLDGPLVDQYASQIMGCMAAILMYWFGAGAALPHSGPRPGRSTDLPPESPTEKAP